jgi:N-acetylneuraminic acid mutarotase
MKRQFFLLTAAILSIATTDSAKAHFPWLMTTEDGRAIYFFGETIDEKTYKLPPSMAKAEVSLITADRPPEKVELAVVEDDQFVGLKSVHPLPAEACLASKVTYGVYHGSRLVYYSQHIGGKLPANRESLQPFAASIDFHAQVIDTDSGVEVYVLWQGEPLADAKVRLFCAEGHEEGSATTDSTGRAYFNDKEVEPGINAILVGHTLGGKSGKVGEQEYSSESHYLTVTFADPEDATGDRSSQLNPSVPVSSDSTVSVSSEVYPPIPKTVTSFGAAIADDCLYIYGGHLGRAHEYSATSQANTLWRLDLKNSKSWESLGDGPGLQGLAMVAHGNKLYRLGGFIAKNDDGQEHDLWSQADVNCFDVHTGQWEAFPSLPEPRSSFDAAVLGDRIYVVGGWNIQGSGETTWLDSAYAIDLTSESPTWQRIPDPPFQRRALSVAVHQGKLYAIGGMQQQGGPSTRVDVFDPQTQTWSRGPDLNGEAMDGFGNASFAVGDELFVTTYSGKLQRLAADGGAWETRSQLERDRFFHRLLPISEHELIVIGGASMSSGKFAEIDVIRVR